MKNRFFKKFTTILAVGMIALGGSSFVEANNEENLRIMREEYSMKTVFNMHMDYWFFYNPNTGQTWCEDREYYPMSTPNYSYFNPKNPYEKACDYN